MWDMVTDSDEIPRAALAQIDAPLNLTPYVFFITKGKHASINVAYDHLRRTVSLNDALQVSQWLENEPICPRFGNIIYKLRKIAIGAKQTFFPACFRIDQSFR